MDQSLTAELEQLSDRSMPGTRRSRIGEWHLRSDLGATGRANTVWPTGQPVGPIRDMVDEIEDWYRAQHIRPGFQIFDGTSPALIQELDRREYVKSPGALVLTSDIGDLNLTADPSDTRKARGSTEPSAEFGQLVDEPDRVQEMTSTALPQLFLTVHDTNGRTLGGGKATLDSDWLGIFAMNTAVEARRTGVANRVLGDLVSYGTDRGATRLWLQVMTDNKPARQHYTGAGMSECHRYHYRFAAIDETPDPGRTTPGC